MATFTNRDIMCGSIDLVVKLGGSAITEKENLETLRPDCVDKAAQIIKRCVESGLKCIVIHGAGSFGHHPAKSHNVVQGFLNSAKPDDVKQGFCITRQSVLKLNRIVTDSLMSHGLKAVSLSCCGIWKTDKRVVTEHGCPQIQGLLDAGFIPVLHGDCVLDKSLGCTILSGDTIIKVISSQFAVKRVVFLTDVAGIYDRPPDEPGAQLIPEVKVNSKGQLDISISTSSPKIDVTGGVQLKLNTACTIVTSSHGQTPVLICDVNSDSAASACLSGHFKDGQGTIINYSHS